MSSFHEILFPLDIALKSAGGPERRTDVVVLGSGREERNTRWAHSRRRYDAGYGVKTFDALSQVVAFFEERRGRLYGFRWRDRLDHSSAAPDASVSATDQTSAENTSETIAADLAARELSVEQRERELATQVVLAEQGRWYTALPRPLFAFAFVIYARKVVVFDKCSTWARPIRSPAMWRNGP
jgi:Conserved hypothetical protein 2217 (DUF2460)